MVLPTKAAPTPNQDEPLTFAHDVLPIFKAHCIECHGGQKTKAGLDLRTFEATMKGGSSGTSVIKGKSQDSLLLKRILGMGGEDRMPLGFAPLSEKDTATIKQWIDQGALPGTDLPAKKHWAFLNPVRPGLPFVKDKAWVRNPIDNFVLARLEQENLHPSVRADKTTLIRRLTLDLTGLPPTPQEVDAFNTDQSPNAYEKVVDRLLASPHFGERMAWPWLDAARYADSNGFQQDGDNYQYVWRDWVVNAINRDMPFDKFTIEQLAGDLLPNPTTHQLVATAFNRNHMLNGEGGAIPEEQRNVILFDRVDVTSTTWMALTMACARCHDHKYDPVTQGDYYSLMAYFNNVPESGVPPGGGQYRIADPWIYAGNQNQIGQLENAKLGIAAYEKLLKQYEESRDCARAQKSWEVLADLAALLGEQNKIDVTPWIDRGSFPAESYDAAFDNEFPLSEGAATTGLIDGTVHQLDKEKTAYYFEKTFTTDRKAKLLLSFGSDDGLRVRFNGAEIVNDKSIRAAILDSNLVPVLLKPGKNTLLMKVVNNGGIGGFVFSAYPGLLKPDLLRIVRTPQKERLASDAAKLRTEFLAQAAPPQYVSDRNVLNGLRQELDSLQKGLPKVMVMSDDMPRKTHIFSRGDYEQPLEEVNATTPKVLPPLPNSKPSNRLDLARWLVSNDNPLTARVAVNRYWQMFFGQGLVRTSENFGIQGEHPSHPELLDWLAVDFRESGWKVNRLIKSIVMSATYRQSSKVTSELLKKDQDNRLLARGARFRVASPFLRDIALASSGLLNPAIGGKPVYPYQPKGIWDGLAITLERDFTYPQSTGPDLYRRSLYTFWRRTVAPGNMFDASSRQACTVRASLTSTPLHALTTLNDVTWVEAARVLAQSVMNGCCPSNQFSEAFRRVCARRPTPAESKILKASYERALKAYQADPQRAKDLLAVGETPTDPKLDRAKLAAFASVCLAIYNLDEALTRE